MNVKILDNTAFLFQTCKTHSLRFNKKKKEKHTHTHKTVQEAEGKEVRRMLGREEREGSKCTWKTEVSQHFRGPWK